MLNVLTINFHVEYYGMNVKCINSYHPPQVKTVLFYSLFSSSIIPFLFFILLTPRTIKDKVPVWHCCADIKSASNCAEERNCWSYKHVRCLDILFLELLWICKITKK